MRSIALAARLSVALLIVLAAATPGRAADLPREAFYGTFSGGGVSSNKDSLYFAITSRDLDVVIRPAGAGFSVEWTTVIRRGGDPKKPDVRRRSTSRTFQPAGRPGLWRCTDSGDALAGEQLCWARIHGNTLTVYEMTVLRDGRYSIQKYDRTLSGSGMELVFTRIRDGEPVRTVKGRLVKSGN